MLVQGKCLAACHFLKYWMIFECLLMCHIIFSQRVANMLDPKCAFRSWELVWQDKSGKTSPHLFVCIDLGCTLVERCYEMESAIGGRKPARSDSEAEKVTSKKPAEISFFFCIDQS